MNKKIMVTIMLLILSISSICFASKEEPTSSNGKMVAAESMLYGTWYNKDRNTMYKISDSSVSITKIHFVNQSAAYLDIETVIGVKETAIISHEDDGSIMMHLSLRSGEYICDMEKIN